MELVFLFIDLSTSGIRRLCLYARYRDWAKVDRIRERQHYLACKRAAELGSTPNPLISIAIWILIALFFIFVFAGLYAAIRSIIS